MSSHFDLIATADSETGKADLRLLDGHGNQLAYHQADFGAIPVSVRQGLFDLRDYLRLYVEEGEEERSLAEIGVCIAEQVLGEEIFRHLWATKTQRTLRLRLLGAGQEGNPLAGGLARIPWELGRPDLSQPTLAERNLLIRVVSEGPEQGVPPLVLQNEEPLRLLFVFAEARGSRPLAARKERRDLLRLLDRQIYPKRRVVAHFLTLGVTRERLRSQIQENGGYAVLHWSGHGHRNLLELARPDGSAGHITGEELVELLTEGGQPLPRLVFLSACHSGELVPIRDWNDFFAQARGDGPSVREAVAPAERKIDLAVQPGYTGTAHTLIEGGATSVVAMRYAVGDEYARDLAVAFYDALLAHPQPKSVAAALNLARRSLLDAENAGERYGPCDPATPLLYGAEDAGLPLPQGRSPALEARNRRLPQIAELSATAHAHFAGRTWELAGLGAEVIGSRAGEEVRPIALITGLGGMGKTALLAEALMLWEERFDWLFLFQAKPGALPFEATLRDLHLRLVGELGVYHQHLKTHPADAIYREASGDLTGPGRMERLTTNLIRALRDEPILLVLDNFETNLKSDADPVSGLSNSEPLWACHDPAWERFLFRLATELAGSPSRVLVTCRQPLTALEGDGCHRVRLGPLRPAEAAVYLREHPALSAMVFGGDEEEEALARRLLAASRFHPLLLDRLARLAAGGGALRPRLLEALETLECRTGFEGLPALFATRPGDAQELAYLDDALAASLDRLIAGAGRETKRLLWMIAVANEPVDLRLLRSVWTGETGRVAGLRQAQALLENFPQLPPELQERLRGLPPELRAEIDALQLPVFRPDPAPLLRSLLAVGLVTEEHADAEEENPALACHELVRERIRIWMRIHPDDQADLAENDLRLVYADRLEDFFRLFQHQDMSKALEAGRRALVYRVQAGAYDHLASFASRLVTSTQDPRLLAGLLPQLEASVEAAQEGRSRWTCLSVLADALRNSGRPDASLPFYERAAMQARQAASAPDEKARQAWGDLASIQFNWSYAIRDTGNLAGAQRMLLDGAKSEQNAGRPEIMMLGCQLEALRIDIRLGKKEQARHQIEAGLAKVETWWERHCGGQPVPEAPDAVFLARVLLGALDIASEADRERGDWESALGRYERILAVKRAIGQHDQHLAATRLNRAQALTVLRRFPDAQSELRACLESFEGNPVGTAMTLGALAALFSDQGDYPQAIVQERRALALFQELDDPMARAGSHHNLASYLEQSATPPAIAEVPLHRLADLIYCLVAGLIQSLQTSYTNYAVRFRRARAAGTTLTPRVAELLADPDFRSLEEWLRERGVKLEELQATVDETLEQIRLSALAQP